MKPQEFNLSILRAILTRETGTWVNSDESDEIPSNVTRLCRALNTNTPTSPITRRSKTQLIYYHRGIGTDGKYFYLLYPSTV